MARGRTKVVIGELVFRVRASSTDFDKAVNQMVRKVERFGKRLDQMGQGMIKAFAPLTAGFALVTRTGMQFADTLSTLSERMSDSSKSIHALRVLADRTGASYGRMEKGLNNVLQRTNQAAGGNEGYRKAIADLGLSMDELMKMPVTRRMEAIARAYTGAADKAKAYNAMTTLVGTFSTPELIASLTTLGTDGLDPLMDKYQRLGLLVEDSTVDVLARAQSSLNFLSSRWQTFATTIGAAVAPVIEKLVAVASILMDRIQEIDTETIQWIAGLTVAGTTIGITAVVMGKLLGPMARVIGAIGVMTFRLATMSVAWLASTGPIGLAVAALVAVGAGILFFTGQLDDMIEKIAGPEVRDAIADLRDEFIDTAKAIGYSLYRNIRDGIADAIRDATLYDPDFRVWYQRLLFGHFPKIPSMLKHASERGIVINHLTGRVTMRETIAGGSPARLPGPTVNMPTARTRNESRATENADRLESLGANAKKTLGLIVDGIGDRLGEVFSGLGVKDWMDKTLKGLGISSDQINKLLEDIIDVTKSGADQTVKAVDGVTSAIKSNPYSSELQEYAKQTLKDIESGKLSTDRRTRIEAEAIAAGKPIEIKSTRFERFQQRDALAKTRAEAEYAKAISTPDKLPWIVREGWDDPNAPIVREGWDAPKSKKASLRDIAVQEVKEYNQSLRELVNLTRSSNSILNRLL